MRHRVGALSSTHASRAKSTSCDMAFALHFRSHPWHPISTAPCNRGVELRVREGRAISTLEFPCRQTNAGDWINCDFGTPINIQPVEWRAWHGHSPQPQSLQVNTRGRLALPHRGHRAAKRSPPAEVKLLDRPVRRAEKPGGHGVRADRHRRYRDGRRFAHAHKRMGIADRVDCPDASGVRQRNRHRRSEARATENSCKEFGAAFLNSACLTRHKKFAVRRTHRVATFVIGRSDAQQ